MRYDTWWELMKKHELTTLVPCIAGSTWWTRATRRTSHWCRPLTATVRPRRAAPSAPRTRTTTTCPTTRTTPTSTTGTTTRVRTFIEITRLNTCSQITAPQLFSSETPVYFPQGQRSKSLGHEIRPRAIVSGCLKLWFSIEAHQVINFDIRTKTLDSAWTSRRGKQI